jgi:hypothetical protein
MIKKTFAVLAGSRRIAACGDAESDPKLEIVIDFDPHGRTGVRIGTAGSVY